MDPLEAIGGGTGLAALGAVIGVIVQRYLAARSADRKAELDANAAIEAKRIEEEAETARARIDAEQTGRHRVLAAESEALPALERSWQGRVEQLERLRVEDGRRYDRRDRECRRRDEICQERLATHGEALHEVLALLTDQRRAQEIRDRIARATEPPPQVLPTVLLVEDEESVRRVTARLIEATGLYTVIAVSSVRHALRELGSSRAIDLLVTDWSMRGLDGSDLVRQLRSARPGLPVVVLTGSPGNVPRGVVEYVVDKGQPPTALMGAIAAALGVVGSTD